MGWEQDPSGLHEILTRVRRDYGDIPIYITENGAAFDDGTVVDGVVDDAARDRVPARAPRGARRRDRRRGRRTPLLRLVVPGQLRVGARLRAALRDRARRLQDAASARPSAARSGTATTSRLLAGSGADGRDRVRGREQGVPGRDGRRARPRPGDPRRRVHDPRRPVRVGQVDGAADGGRARGGDRGHDPDRRARRHRTWRRRTATSRWCSRATRCTRT